MKKTEGRSAQEPARIETEFLKSAPGIDQCPRDEVPEVAIAGRSNAGKSSVLNRLTGNRSTAKVSRTPGRTQLLNLFAVRGGGRLVDLPGYGYAKADRESQRAWQNSVNTYLEQRANLVGLIMVMDIRHPLEPLDQQLLQWTEVSRLPALLLLNKADKLGYGAAQQVLARTRSRATGAEVSVMTFSALRGLHVDEVIDWVRERLSTAPQCASSQLLPTPTSTTNGT
ncbi:MAG: ribosome biogenesis GTP-binding protein YihA/YsxC [Pseudomonadales bacterium]|jgi:GTP-binding protein